MKTGPLGRRARARHPDVYSGSHPNAVVVARRPSTSPTVTTTASPSSSRGHLPRTPAHQPESSARASGPDAQGHPTGRARAQPRRRALCTSRKRGSTPSACPDCAGSCAKVVGHIPTAAGGRAALCKVSADGRTLYVANARGRGAGPFDDCPPDNLGRPSERHRGLGEHHPGAVTSGSSALTERVYAQQRFRGR